jgi:hypothetical protein
MRRDIPEMIRSAVVAIAALPFATIGVDLVSDLLVPAPPPA